jgi:hypothetical protein
MEKGSTWINVGAALCLVAACVSIRSAAADEGLLARITAYSDPPDVTVSDQDSSDNSSTNSSTTCTNCGEATTDCCCGACGPPGRFWFRDEYVGGWIQGGRVPTLLATSPNGTLPATTPLYGNATYNGGFRSGNWVQGGMWSDCCRTCGVQGDFLFLGRQSSPFFASSDGDPVITRPFTDANTGDPTEQLIAFPNTVVGCVSVTNYNSFAAAGGALRHNLCCWIDCCDKGCDKDCDKDGGTGCGGCWCEQNCSRLDFVGGFRYYRFNDNLGVREQLTSIDQQSGIPVGTQFNVSDSFRTQNNFYGGEFGLISTRYRGCWMFEGAARVALGATQQIVAIDGSTVVSFPGQPTAINQGGILALSSNIGRYTHNNFTAIPQLSGRIGYRLTERLTFLVGYTAIYWGRVARAGDQIDTAVNPNLIPPPISGGPNRPSFTLHNSDLWLQGITLGAEIYF